MEQQHSFEEKTSKDSPKKMGDSALHPAAWAGNVAHIQKRIDSALLLHLAAGNAARAVNVAPVQKRGDSGLHLAARAGNVALVQKIFADCDPELVAELAAHQNQDGETALYVSAEMGHVEVVCEILKVCDLHSAWLKAHNSFDAFHIAAKQGHLG